MNKLLKNPLVLSMLLFGIDTILAIILMAVTALLKLGFDFSPIAAIIGAVLIGQLYAANFKEIMPKVLRIKVVSIAVAVQLLLGILYMLVLIPPTGYVVFVSILVAVGFIYAIGSYWMISLGGRTYLISMQKRKQ